MRAKPTSLTAIFPNPYITESLNVDFIEPIIKIKKLIYVPGGNKGIEIVIRIFHLKTENLFQFSENALPVLISIERLIFISKSYERYRQVEVVLDKRAVEVRKFQKTSYVFYRYRSFLVQNSFYFIRIYIYVLFCVYDKF